jgi:hypothetical protein
MGAQAPVVLHADVVEFGRERRLHGRGVGLHPETDGGIWKNRAGCGLS